MAPTFLRHYFITGILCNTESKVAGGLESEMNNCVHCYFDICAKDRRKLDCLA